VAHRRVAELLGQTRRPEPRTEQGIINSQGGVLFHARCGDYVQYAHARIASIGRKAAEVGVERRPLDAVDLRRLTHERELELLRTLAAYPETLADAALVRAPHRVTTWVRDFAKSFHGFYRDCRVIGEDPEITQARLWLAEAARIGLATALAILGVGAPDKMARLDDEA
jgi:arginyl-tRNA synthetase